MEYICQCRIAYIGFFFLCYLKASDMSYTGWHPFFRSIYCPLCQKSTFETRLSTVNFVTELSLCPWRQWTTSACTTDVYRALIIRHEPIFLCVCSTLLIKSVPTWLRLEELKFEAKKKKRKKEAILWIKMISSMLQWQFLLASPCNACGCKS